MPHPAQLGDLERAVMDTFWQLPAGESRTVRQIHESLIDRNLAYTTVMTVMDRLAGKEMLVQERAGRAYRYHAANTRADVTASLMHQALDGVGSSERSSALVSFVGAASPDEVAALKRALDQLG